MKRLFLLTPEAKSDLKEIFLDIAEDSPDTAERLRSEFHEGLQALGRSPGSGHYHDEPLSRKYPFWNFYSYVVAYVWQVESLPDSQYWKAYLYDAITTFTSQYVSE